MKEVIINLINKWGCHHDWKLIRETEVFTDFGGNYTALLFVCKKCGKFKKLKLIQDKSRSGFEEARPCAWSDSTLNC